MSHEAEPTHEAPTELHPALEAPDLLQREHELDDVALYEEPAAGSEASGLEGVPPPGSGLRRRTRILAVALVGSLFFLAGIQCQKLTSRSGQGSAQRGAAGQRPASLPPRGQEGSGAVASTLARGEVIAIRDSAIYLRDPEGNTLKVTATPGSRVARAQPTPLDDVQPGERVAVEFTRTPEGKLEAVSITVLPPRSGPRAR
jgi:hypothetical protein